MRTLVSANAVSEMVGTVAVGSGMMRGGSWSPVSRSMLPCESSTSAEQLST